MKVKIRFNIPYMWHVYIFLGNMVAWPLSAFSNNFLKVHRILALVFAAALGVLIAAGFGMTPAAIWSLWPLYLVYGFYFAIECHRVLLTMGTEPWSEWTDVSISLASGLLFGLVIAFFLL